MIELPLKLYAGEDTLVWEGVLKVIVKAEPPIPELKYNQPYLEMDFIWPVSVALLTTQKELNEVEEKLKPVVIKTFWEDIP